MKVLAINGSPRKDGNTATLLAALLRGVEEAGGEINLVPLRKRCIQPCIGCGACSATGKCVLLDDMQALYPEILAADRIVLASPIYFYGITAQAKAFVDRCQALWSRQRLAGHREDQEASGRKGLLVSVAASQGKRVFDGAILTARYAFEAMGVQYGGDLLVRGVDSLGAMAKETETLIRAERIGREFMS